MKSRDVTIRVVIKRITDQESSNGQSTDRSTACLTE